jgi:hypothetical protein
MYTEFTVGIGTIVLFVLVGFLSGLLFRVKRWHRQRIVNLIFKTTGPVTKGSEGEIKMTEVTLTNEQKVKVSVAGLTEGGQVVPLDKLEANVASGDGKGEMIDATSFYAISGSAIGDTVINVLGTISGVVLQGQLIMHVIAAKTIDVQIKVGIPELK